MKTSKSRDPTQTSTPQSGFKVGIFFSVKTYSLTPPQKRNRQLFTLFTEKKTQTQIHHQTRSKHQFSKTHS